MERLRAGDSISFVAKEVLPDGSVRPFPVSGQITSRWRGGFHGEVFALADEQRGLRVIKTARPIGLVRRWGRFLNWDGRLFPPQVSEAAAGLEFLSQKLASQILPPLFEVNVADVGGWGLLPRYGYVLDLEYLHGRKPHFEHGFGEYSQLMEKRRLISEFGFEIRNPNLAGQTHPGNVFGLENLWMGEDGRVQLVDQLPAIRHTGRFLGFPLSILRFQQEIRDRIGGGQVVFDEVDTDAIRVRLNQDPSWNRLDRGTIHGYLDCYDEYRRRLNEEMESDRAAWNLAALARLGIIAAPPENFVDYLRLIPRLIGTEAEEITAEVAERIKENYFVRFFTDSEHRKLVLSGLSMAEAVYQAGAISADELKEIKELGFGNSDRLSPDQRRQLRNYLVLGGFFITTSRLWDLAGAAAALQSERLYPGNHFLAAVIGLTVAAVLPPATRYLVARPFSWLTKQNTDIISSVAPIPALGGILAVPAQLAVNPELAEVSQRLWHYTIRGLVSKFAVAPWGGIGTDQEARWLLALAKHQCFLYKHLRIPPFIDDERTTPA